MGVEDNLGYPYPALKIKMKNLLFFVEKIGEM